MPNVETQRFPWTIEQITSKIAWLERLRIDSKESWSDMTYAVVNVKEAQVRQRIAEWRTFATEGRITLNALLGICEILDRRLDAAMERIHGDVETCTVE